MLLVTCAVGACAMAVGCRAYQIGSPSMYRPDVRSVNVAVFESDSYRKFLGQRFTEAVVKQIELNTSFQLADEATADSFLRGRIVRDTKSVKIETIDDDPRDLAVGLQLEVTWTDRAGLPLMPRQVLRLNRSIDFIPEGGQSLAVVQQELINLISRQIVQQMEMPW